MENETKTTTAGGQTDFDRDVALCDQNIAELEAAIRAGGGGSAFAMKEFVGCWRAYRKAKPGSTTQKKFEERLNKLSESTNVEDLRQTLRRWVEQRRRLIDTQLKAEASAKRGKGDQGVGWLDLDV